MRVDQAGNLKPVKRDRMARRHKLDIMAEILRLSMVGTRKTRLVYLANLNFLMLNKYLKLLEEKGFVYIHSNRIYTTREGAEYLKQYEELMMAWNLTEHKVNHKETRNRARNINM
jgi:predicted transcriptional regulator